MKKIDFKLLALCLLIVYSIGLLGSFFTSPNSDWYSFIKPSITPPNFVFPIVWNVLFFLIGLSLYFSLVNSKNKIKKKIYFLFGINLILNFLWSVFFFGLKNPLLSFIDLLALLFSILFLIIFMWKIKKVSSYLLVPYLLWVCFAGVLNWLILRKFSFIEFF